MAATAAPVPDAVTPEAAEAAERAYRQALERGVRCLTLREHSRGELIGKLEAKGVPAAMARLVVDDLGGRGLQSDERFAEQFVRGRVERGYGPIWIRLALTQRGIGGDLAEAVLDHPDRFWADRAAVARRRRFGDELPGDGAGWNRQARFLAQRGFPADLIYRVLGRRR